MWGSSLDVCGLPPRSSKEKGCESVRARMSQAFGAWLRFGWRERANGGEQGEAAIKAGLKLRGRPAGGVRPPLVDPSPKHEAELRAIIERGLALVEGR